MEIRERTLLEKECSEVAFETDFLFFGEPRSDHLLIEKFLKESPRKPICMDAPSLEPFGEKNIHHISKFLNTDGSRSLREDAKNKVSDFSKKIMLSSGKPIYQSLVYKNINLWWTIEIILHEPCYLKTRKEDALFRATSCLGAGFFRVSELRSSENQKLPEVFLFLRKISTLLVETRRRWVKKTKNSFKLAFFNLQKLLIRRSKIVSWAEIDNFRFHRPIGEKKVIPFFPYAEGVFEKIEKIFKKSFFLGTRMSKKSFLFDIPSLRRIAFPTPKDSMPKHLIQAFDDLVFEIENFLPHVFSREQLEDIFLFRIAEVDTYYDLLKKLDPEIIFLYNWEGVYRPLLAVARTLGIKTIGLQQALGPYLHALDHRDVGYYDPQKNPMGFVIPDRIALWGEHHKKNLMSYGYPESSLVITGYPRLDRHYEIAHARSNPMHKAHCCRVLGLPSYKRYLMFTGQVGVIGTSIIRKDHFKTTLQKLFDLSLEFDFLIILKPWSGDEWNFIEEVAEPYRGRIFIAYQNCILHNAELLSISDWLVGTFSSILGEATLTHNACLMINYPESQYYFDHPHFDIFKSLFDCVDRPEDLENKLRPLLSSEELRLSAIHRARTQLEPLFGPCDGQSADRVVQCIEDILSKKNKRKKT